MISERGNAYKRALYGEYAELARYYLVMARAKRIALTAYVRTEEEIEEAKRDIEWHEFNALDYKEKANQLKGDDNGFESKDLRSTGVPSELSRQSEQFERVNCTTVV